MNVLSILGLLILSIGHIWFAWEVWQREDLIWGILVFLIPFPLFGLYVWYRADWSSSYKFPCLIYLAGYAMELIGNVL